MFAAKVDGGAGGGGIGAGGAGGGIGASEKERKLSNSSAGSGIKSKWVKAFKGIKMNKEDDMSDPRYESTPSPVPTCSSIFQLTSVYIYCVYLTAFIDQCKRHLDA